MVLSGTTVWSAYAKINLYLDILGVKGSLHRILSVMQSVSLADELRIRRVPDPGVQVKCNHKELEKENILSRVYNTLKLVYPQDLLHGYQVELEKRIPMGAGLAGGSADAAAFLHHILIDTQLKVPRLLLRSIIQRIGSDVHFCVRGGTSIVAGTGDKQQPFDAEHLYPAYLLLNTGLHIPTVDAYAWWDEHVRSGQRTPPPNPEENVDKQPFFNAFEQVVMPRHPQLEVLKQALLSVGAAQAIMSGSGSTIIGAFHTEAAATKAQAAFAHLPVNELVVPVPSGVEQQLQ